MDQSIRSSLATRKDAQTMAPGDAIVVNPLNLRDEECLESLTLWIGLSGFDIVAVDCIVDNESAELW